MPSFQIILCCFYLFFSFSVRGQKTLSLKIGNSYFMRNHLRKVPSFSLHKTNILFNFLQAPFSQKTILGWMNGSLDLPSAMFQKKDWSPMLILLQL